jgi:hypothetical protein
VARNEKENKEMVSSRSLLRQSELGTHKDEVELSDVLLVPSSDDGDVLEVGEGLLVAGSSKEEGDCV